MLQYTCVHCDFQGLRVGVHAALRALVHRLAVALVPSGGAHPQRRPARLQERQHARLLGQGPRLLRRLMTVMSAGSDKSKSASHARSCITRSPLSLTLTAFSSSMLLSRSHMHMRWSVLLSFWLQTISGQMLSLDCFSAN